MKRPVTMKPRMKLNTRKPFSMVTLLLPACWVLTAQAAPPFELVSKIAPELAPAAGGGGDSYSPVISRDGRYVLFASSADNLVSLDTNQPLPAMIPAPLNVFLRDRTKGSTVLVSINLSGSGGGDADSLPIGISTNGRYALFESSADNLVPGDTNNASDVFVRDLVAGTTLLVSINTNGTSADDVSYSSAMTPDGRYVVFTSAADDLVPGDTNAIPDVFVRDLAGNTTSLISLGAQPGPGPYSWVGSDGPALTPDGRFVAFYSTATNLVPGVGTTVDIYLRDRLMANTTWVSKNALPALQSLRATASALSFSQVVSDDGRFVAFEASPFPQASGQPNLVLRYDLLTDQTELIETNASVSPSASFQELQNVAMTPDGRLVIYVANALDNTGTTTCIRAWDAQTGSNILVSANQTNSVSPGSFSDSPVLDDRGRFVAFVSNAPDLVTNQIPGDFHLYLRDLQTTTTSLIDGDTNGIGSPIDPSSAAVMSADGRFVAFSSQDGSLVPDDRNRAYDVFVRDVTNATSELISAHDPQLPSFTPDGPSAISRFSLSFDAHLLAFWSEADDLVLDDTNGVRDIYIRDLAAGTNLLVSRNTNGVAADGLSTDPAISADGQHVAFSSLADDLVSGDTNQAEDVFVSALAPVTPQLVSINAAGTGPGNADSYSPVLSSNGQFVLFHSQAGNLVSGMTSGTENLFWRDLQAQRTYALTTNGVTDAAMTPDGRFVAFITSSSKSFSSSLSDRLYLWDSQATAPVYSLSGMGFASVAVSPDGQRLAYATNNGAWCQLSGFDRSTGTNRVIAVYRAGASPAPRFNAGARWLAYVAGIGSLTTTNQVYLYDFDSGTNRLISQSADGLSPGDGNSDSPDISPDGRWIAYRSTADNLVSGDTNGVPDIFLYDQVNGTTTLVTASRFGNTSADNRSLMPVFSPDSRTLVFESWASDLIPNDFNNNADVFALGLDTSAVIPSFTATVVPGAGAGAGSWLSWPVVPGKSYHVQFKTQLTDPAWQELNTSISVMGDRASCPLSTVPGTSQFYRIVAY